MRRRLAKSCPRSKNITDGHGGGYIGVDRHASKCVALLGAEHSEGFIGNFQVVREFHAISIQ